MTMAALKNLTQAGGGRPRGHGRVQPRRLHCGSAELFEVEGSVPKLDQLVALSSAGRITVRCLSGLKRVDASDRR